MTKKTTFSYIVAIFVLAFGVFGMAASVGAQYFDVNVGYNSGYMYPYGYNNYTYGYNNGYYGNTYYDYNNSYYGSYNSYAYNGPMIAAPAYGSYSVYGQPVQNYYYQYPYYYYGSNNYTYPTYGSYPTCTYCVSYSYGCGC